MFDVTGDLAAYTGLDLPLVEDLLQRRSENFRSEWLAFPARFRRDRWFYLSSRMYLFGNAVHVHDDPKLIDTLDALAQPDMPTLEFGGGTGNVALALGARGRDVEFLELSALQKDFVRFRIDRYGLGERVRVLDEWQALPESRYGLIVALDVLEHIPDLELTARQLLAALAPKGVLVENSAFGSSAKNPMHLPDELDLVRFLRSHLSLAAETDRLRTWRLSSPAD